MKLRLGGSAVVTAVGSGLTFLIHQPRVGIDDANITQVYAQHIAQGAGYVYNLGQEHVEGSTSLLWTLVNVLAFWLSDTPEAGLALLCLLLTWASVWATLTLARRLALALDADPRWAQVLAGCALLGMPSWFAWSAWTLMDLSLWVLAFTVASERLLTLVLQVQPGEPHLPRAPQMALWPLWVAVVTLPLIRPEGIVVSVMWVLTSLTLASWRQDRRLWRQACLFGGVTLTLLTAVTVWRLAYFGYPVPNTFYAKVSSGLVDQARAGSWYLQRFLMQGLVALMLAGSAMGAWLLWRTAPAARQGGLAAWALLAPIVLILGIYTGVGGDHFGSFRQFQVIVPLMAAGAGAGAIAWLSMSRPLWPGAVLATALIALSVPTWLRYATDKGHIDVEFRLAEDGRKMGAQLNVLPHHPPVAITAAGGVARTYQGQVVDLLGLNWTEMAHAKKVRDPSRPKNHQSFDKATMFRAQPAIVLPKVGGCDERLFDNDAFMAQVLDHLFSDPLFREQYTFSCVGDTRLYVLRSERTALALPDLARTRHQALASPAP